MICDPFYAPYWNWERDKLLVRMRTFEYDNQFEIQDWTQVKQDVHPELWVRIADDTRFTHRFTPEECQARFNVLVDHFNMIRALPKPLRKLYHWTPYSFFRRYYKSIIEAMDRFHRGILNDSVNRNE